MSSNTNNLSDVRWEIAKQIVKAKIPGYKMTRGDLHEEARHVPDVYIDNILKAVLALLPEKLGTDSPWHRGYDGAIDQTRRNLIGEGEKHERN